MKPNKFSHQGKHTRSITNARGLARRTSAARSSAKPNPPTPTPVQRASNNWKDDIEEAQEYFEQLDDYSERSLRAKRGGEAKCFEAAYKLKEDTAWLEFLTDLRAQFPNMKRFPKASDKHRALYYAYMLACKYDSKLIHKEASRFSRGYLPYWNSNTSPDDFKQMIMKSSAKAMRDKAKTLKNVDQENAALTSQEQVVQITGKYANPRVGIIKSLARNVDYSMKFKVVGTMERLTIWIDDVQPC